MIPESTFERFLAECKERNLDGETVRKELVALRKREDAKAHPGWWNKIKRALQFTHKP